MYTKFKKNLMDLGSLDGKKGTEGTRKNGRWAN
jgi:hypothetical protein